MNASVGGCRASRIAAPCQDLLGSASSSVNDLHLSGTLEYYLRPDIQVDYRRQAPINPKALAERLGARPAAWFVVRNAGKVNLQEELPPGAVGCEWIYRHLQVIVIARSRSDLPKDLQNCELHNGPL